jgi:hypothetical protein
MYGRNVTVWAEAETAEIVSKTDRLHDILRE